MSDSNIRVGWWDCPQCGKTHIYGLTNKCPGCGYAQDSGVEFYLDESSEYLSKEEASNIDEGPKWYCSYCGTTNRSDDKECNQCGASKDDKSGDYFDHHSKHQITKTEVKKMEYTDNKKINDIPYNNDSHIKYNLNDEKIHNDLNKKRNPILNWISNHMTSFVVTVALIISMIGLFFLCVPKEQTIHVDNIMWQYIVSVDELKTFNESGWTLPYDARLYDKQWQFKETDHVKIGTKTETYYDTERVKVGTERYKSGTVNKGNGTFEDVYSTRDVYETRQVKKTRTVDIYEDVPVYDWKYYYEIDRWVFKKDIVSEGYDKNSYYADFTLAELEKESGRSERYFICTKDKKGEPLTLSIDYEDWIKVDVGEDLRCKIDMFGHLTVIYD